VSSGGNSSGSSSTCSSAWLKQEIPLIKEGEGKAKQIAEENKEFDDDVVEADLLASCCNDTDEDVGDGESLDNSSSRDDNALVEWSFSIVFSDLWNVPVLWFDARYMNGKQVQREDILQLFNYTEKNNNEENRQDEDTNNVVPASYSFISIEEHPITVLPSYFFHPCGTVPWAETSTSDGGGTLDLRCWLASVINSGCGGYFKVSSSDLVV
jgi:hypothetical protein